MSILLFCGSNHRESLNLKLIHNVKNILEQQGKETVLIHLYDHPLPMYSIDEEQQNGIPATVDKLADELDKAKAVFMSVPEYNSSYPAAFKNTIDWISRTDKGLTPFANKPTAIGAVSIGHLGGIRSLSSLRLLLSGIGMNVAGNQIAISNANKKFDNNDLLTSEADKNTLISVIESLYCMVI